MTKLYKILIFIPFENQSPKGAFTGMRPSILTDLRAKNTFLRRQEQIVKVSFWYHKMQENSDFLSFGAPLIYDKTYLHDTNSITNRGLYCNMGF